VPLYGCVQKYIRAKEDPANFSAQELLEEIERQAEQGVDFMTVHCGVTRRAAALVEEAGRVLGVVSRGGSITVRWMKTNNQENPLLTHYDKLLDIAVRHNVTLSLGDGMRPGAGCDAGDPAQWEEVVVLAELTRRAWERGVQVMIEGPGHVPMHQVQAQIQGIKRLCHGAPLYVLGPLTTDSSPGYDHIAGAIGGAMAAYFGADFLCYLTPAEHLTLPDGEDVRQGVLASRIAAQSAENALGRPLAVRRDLAISRARADLDWKAMADLALDPPMVRHRRQDPPHPAECAMCGEYCAVKMLRDFKRNNPAPPEAARSGENGKTARRSGPSFCLGFRCAPRAAPRATGPATVSQRKRRHPRPGPPGYCVGGALQAAAVFWTAPGAGPGSCAPASRRTRNLPPRPRWYRPVPGPPPGRGSRAGWARPVRS
jgi:phosphomethylpyrimidine synthase